MKDKFKGIYCDSALSEFYNLKNQLRLTDEEEKRLFGGKKRKNIIMIEEVKEYKPLSKGSKFLKANKEGQVPKDCIHFNFCGKHCGYGKTYTDCEILKNKFCKKYMKGVE